MLPHRQPRVVQRIPQRRRPVHRPGLQERPAQAEDGEGHVARRPLRPRWQAGGHPCPLGLDRHDPGIPRSIEGNHERRTGGRGGGGDVAGGGQGTGWAAIVYAPGIPIGEGGGDSAVDGGPGGYLDFGLLRFGNET